MLEATVPSEGQKRSVPEITKVAKEATTVPQTTTTPGAQHEEAFEALRRATNKSAAMEMAKHRHDKEKGPSSQIDVGRSRGQSR